MHPIPHQRTTTDLERAIDLLREDIVACEDRGGDSRPLRGHLDLLRDELQAARTA